MRSQKRSPIEKAFAKGYQAAMSGRSWATCPFDAGKARVVWMNGWREGREDHWSGYNTRAQVQKLHSF